MDMTCPPPRKHRLVVCNLAAMPGSGWLAPEFDDGDEQDRERRDETSMPPAVNAPWATTLRRVEVANVVMP